MERPDIPALLRQACEQGCAIDLADVTYYVGHETVSPRDDAKGLPRWVEAAVRADAAQLRTRDRLFQIAARRGCRDQAADLDLVLMRIQMAQQGPETLLLTERR